MHEDRSDENHLYEDSRDDDGSTAAACSAVHIDGVVYASRRLCVEGSSGSGSINANALRTPIAGDDIGGARDGQASIPAAVVRSA